MKHITKRTLPLILAFTLILGVLTAGLTSFAQVNYDLNGDNDVDVSDVTTLLNCIAGINPVTDSLDLNGDNDVDVNDVTTLLNYIANPTTGESMVDIVNALYALEAGKSLEGSKTLTGKIVNIDTPYADQYKNITVTIVVPGAEDKPVMCYRLKGVEATDTTPAVDVSGLALLDTITVTGTLTNYRGTYEFTSGCLCTEIVPTTSNVGLALGNINFASSYNGGSRTDAPSVDDEYEDVSFSYTATAADGGLAPVSFRNDMMIFNSVSATTLITVTVTATDGVESLSKTFSISIIPAGQEESMEDIVRAAYALGVGESLSGTKTLQGVITSIQTAYTASNGITLFIQVGDLDNYPIECYRMVNGEGITAGKGVEVIKKGDTITVSGTLTRYNSTTVEFAAGCTLDSVDEVAELPAGYTTSDEIVEAAFALNQGEALDRKYSLTGTIKKIDTVNVVNEVVTYVTLWITVSTTNLGDKDIQCYHLVNGTSFAADKGIAEIKVKDVITVNGLLKNYNGTVEFDNGCTLESIDEVYQPSAQEKLADELAALTLVDSVRTETSIDLPATGATNTDVTFTWSSNDSVHAPIGNGVLNLIPGTTDATVTITVLAICVNETATKTFTIQVLAPASGSVTDTLTVTETGMTGTSYNSWAYSAATGSGTIYDGQSAAGNDAIQLRSRNSNSGIVNTSSVGKILSVSVTFNTATSANQQIWIYASKTAFTAPTNLYSNTDAKIAELTYTEGTVTYTYTFTDDYAYVGIRSGNGAIWLDSVSFTWEAGAVIDPGENPTETPDTPEESGLELTFPSYNDKAIGSYTDTWTATVSGQVWTLTNFNNNNSNWAYVRCGRKNVESVGTISTTFTNAIASFDVTIDNVTADKINSITLYVINGNDSQSYALNIETGTQTVTIPASARVAGATYTFEFNCQAGAGNGLVQLSKIVATEA